MKQIPRILCIGGHDPTGGAGIQADIETVSALGGQALTLVTALTAQDTTDVAAVLPTPPASFVAQLDRLLADVRADAVKIGMIGSAALIPPLRELLEGFPGPVVLDPVLAAGGGFDLASDALTQAIRRELLSHTTLVTPNRAEARRLAACEDADAAAQCLLDAGAAAVLLTGADEAGGGRVRNRLFSRAGPPRDFEWPRLPHRYHGSGCTLASACATRLAFGDPPADAAEAAQAFTWRALESALAAGRGQRLPWRRGA
jgi:hydroxymethylpyrimidine/phosphomethylpyrimidine kinase